MACISALSNRCHREGGGLYDRTRLSGSLGDLRGQGRSRRFGESADQAARSTCLRSRSTIAR
jgi:hypothetical protein